MPSEAPDRRSAAAVVRGAGRACSPALALLLAISLGACQRQMLESSAVDKYPSGDDELDYLSQVNDMTAVTNNDALHGLLLFADGADPFTTYEERVEGAKSRRWMPSGFDAPANESATVGWMAMAGCQICNIKGGVTMHLLGPTPRYCTKELVFMQVIPLRTENQSLTGAEFTDYLNRLHRIRAGKPGEPGSQAAAAAAAGPAGEQSATPMNESDVEETLPSPTP
ncbi:MAG: hypothetical protein FJ253_04075 [Phycisphaerae bacterium]|nr:hypothetical protein [Phycisphaerae bacterium]